MSVLAVAAGVGVLFSRGGVFVAASPGREMEINQVPLMTPWLTSNVNQQCVTYLAQVPGGLGRTRLELLSLESSVERRTLAS